MKKALIIALIAVSAVSFVSCKHNSAEAPQIDPNTQTVSVLKEKVLSDGTRELSVKPNGVCSTQIDLTVKDGIILDAKITDGCPGNTAGVCELIKGMTAEEAIARLKGIDCAGKGTSCPDQLALALEYLQK